MAQITTTEHDVHIGLSLWEHLAGLMGGRTIPRSAITEVSLEPDPLQATKGLRAPGLGVPGAAKVGTWRGQGRRMFVNVRRGVPAVRIEVTGLDRDAFLVSVPDAAGIVAELSS
jgi:hypothetical protein